MQLAPERVIALVEAGDALPFDPGTGSAMKNRVLVPDLKKESWIPLCEESQHYMESML